MTEKCNTKSTSVHKNNHICSMSIQIIITIIKENVNMLLLIIFCSIFFFLVTFFEIYRNKAQLFLKTLKSDIDFLSTKVLDI